MSSDFQSLKDSVRFERFCPFLIFKIFLSMNGKMSLFSRFVQYYKNFHFFLSTNISWIIRLLSCCNQFPDSTKGIRRRVSLFLQTNPESGKPVKCTVLSTTMTSCVLDPLPNIIFLNNRRHGRVGTEMGRLVLHISSRGRSLYNLQKKNGFVKEVLSTWDK